MTDRVVEVAAVQVGAGRERVPRAVPIAARSAALTGRGSGDDPQQPERQPCVGRMRRGCGGGGNDDHPVISPFGRASIVVSGIPID